MLFLLGCHPLSSSIYIRSEWKFLTAVFVKKVNWNLDINNWLSCAMREPLKTLGLGNVYYRKQHTCWIIPKPWMNLNDIPFISSSQEFSIGNAVTIQFVKVLQSINNLWCKMLRLNNLWILDYEIMKSKYEKQMTSQLVFELEWCSACFDSWN